MFNVWGHYLAGQRIFPKANGSCTLRQIFLHNFPAFCCIHLTLASLPGPPAETRPHSMTLPPPGVQLRILCLWRWQMDGIYTELLSKVLYTLSLIHRFTHNDSHRAKRIWGIRPSPAVGRHLLCKPNTEDLSSDFSFSSTFSWSCMKMLTQQKLDYPHARVFIQQSTLDCMLVSLWKQGFCILYA